MDKKWNEFDNIHTPESWIEETLQKTRKPYRFSMIKRIVLTTIIIFCFAIGSMGVVYAINPTFREWLSAFFSKENIQQITFLEENEKYVIYDNFLCTYKNEDNITKVYAYRDNRFIKQEIKHYQGQINQRDYAFDYVIENNRFFSFHHTGVILKTYAPIFDQKVYVWLSDENENNLGVLDLDTQYITPITDDGISVNSIVSPNGQYALINKNDEYWTLYDRLSQKEEKINEIHPYAHSNEVRFIDENRILAFSEDDNSMVIDLKTKQVNRYQFQTLDTSVVYLEEDNGQYYLKNILNDNVFKLQDQFKMNYNLRTYGERFLFFYDSDILSIYDINNNRMTEIDVADFDCQFVLELDSQHILFGEDKQIYVVDIQF